MMNKFKGGDGTRVIKKLNAQRHSWRLPPEYKRRPLRSHTTDARQRQNGRKPQTLSIIFCLRLIHAFALMQSTELRRSELEALDGEEAHRIGIGRVAGLQPLGLASFL